MRDPKRIKEFCNELAKMWELVPDWRFGQLIFNVFTTLKSDPFYLEDDRMLEQLKKYFDINSR